MFDSGPNRKSHPILEPGRLDEELATLPPPPDDLPKPWSASSWRRLFVLAFILTTFLLWYIGKLFGIPLLDVFPNACTFSGSLFLIVGLFLMNRFMMRGFYENYSARANKPLNRAIRRYKRKKVREAWQQLFPRYSIDGEDYYMVWYVPNVGTAISRSLGPSAEPLLFDGQGHWIDDEELFNDVLLMWSYGIEMSPRSLQNSLASDYNELKKLVVEHLPHLPHVLARNKDQFLRRGLEDEFNLVLETYPVKCAYHRSSLDFILKKIQWSNAHGGDSLIQLRYKDILKFHQAHVEAFKSRKTFLEKYRIREAEDAAMKLLDCVPASGKLSTTWRGKKGLNLALQVFAAPLPVGDLNFTKVDGRWVGPKDALDAYRSRLAYAREVDAKGQPRQTRPSSN